MTYVSGSITPLSTAHAAGDTGHVDDHNRIVYAALGHDAILSSAALLFSSSALLGSGSTTFSASSLSALINDETGTGSIVFNTSPIFTGTVSGSNVTLTGNLTASSGTTTLNTLSATSASIGVSGSIAGIIVSSSHVEFADPLLYIGTSNASAYDVGFYGHTSNPSYNHFGLARFANDNVWKFFSNFTEPPENSASSQVASANYDIVRMGGIQIYSGSATQSASIASGGQLLLGAGTATVAPLTLISGTNLTTPAAGAIEYDGNNLYFTPNTSLSRSIIPTAALVTASATQATLTNATTAVNLFPTGDSAIVVPANSAYEFELYFATSGSAAASAVTATTLQFAGSASATASISYVAMSTSNTTAGTAAAANMVYGTTTATVTLIPATTNIFRTAYLKGTLRIGATSGSIIPQIAYSVAPSFSSSINAGAYMKIIPIGASAIQATAGWI